MSEIAPGIDDCVLRVPADPVTAPAHYAGDGEVDCRRAMESMHAGWARCRDLYPATPKYELQFVSASYWVTCAFKYLWRWVGKDGAQDLRKAIRCLQYALDAMGAGDE